MRFVEEIVVDEFLPTVRSMLAADLRRRGLTQHEVAEAIGVSQSAVSKYATGDVSTNERIRTDERVVDLVERVGAGLATGEMSRVQALVEVEVLVRRLEDGDLLATLHEESMPELREHGGGFDVHDPDSALRTTEQVRGSVKRGLRILTNTSGFAALVPAVGSNLVECLPGATGVDDVAGVPGRIVDVKGKATVPADPEFGVSAHVATVLLAAREAGADVRAAACIRYDDSLVATLEEDGHEAVEFDAEGESDEASVAAALRVRGVDGLGDVFALYQTGGYGIEPIVYAPTVARVVRALC